MRPGRNGAPFIEGLIDQASENQAKAQAILDLNRQMSSEVANATHSEHANSAVAFLFDYPIFASKHFVKESRILRPTALGFLRALRTKGILRTLREASGPSPRFISFQIG